MTKTIKSVLICYYIPGIVFAGLLIISTYITTTDSLGQPSSIYETVLPIAALITGFFAGRAKSYIKWGYSIYVLLLTFCIEILFFAAASLFLVLLAFGASLAGQVLSHIIMIRRAKR